MDEYSLPVNYPYLMGVYLAVNAAPDLYLFVDGPDCVLFKSEYIQGKHDLYSTLLRCDGPDRVVHAEVDATSIVHDRTAGIRAALYGIDAAPGAGGMVHTSMPMATITGTQYDTIVESMDPPLKLPVYHVPAMSLTKDWLDGYANTLEAIAAGIKLNGGGADPRKVAVVGYFMDRNEWDHKANVAEIEGLLSAAGLEAVSVWLSGRGTEHLARAGEAGLIVSLPHGRAAARVLGERTGAKVVETGLPIGLGGTERWLAEVGAAAGLREEAAVAAAAGLSAAAPRLKWLIGKIFTGKNVFFCGDPHYMAPLHEFLEDLGCRVERMAAVAKEHHVYPLAAGLAEAGVEVRFDIGPEELQAHAAAADGGWGPDIIIANDDGMNRIGVGRKSAVRVPFGFTNYGSHAISESPFMGFRGAVWLADRLAGAILSGVRNPE